MKVPMKLTSKVHENWRSNRDTDTTKMSNVYCASQLPITNTQLKSESIKRQHFYLKISIDLFFFSF